MIEELKKKIDTGEKIDVEFKSQIFLLIEIILMDIQLSS